MSVKIYAIRNHTSTDTYIGSTTKQYLSQRLAQHRYDLRQEGTITSIQVIQCPTAYIELLEECNKNNRYERERWWIENTATCVNKHCKPKTEEEKASLREYKREWARENRDRNVDTERQRKRREDPVYREEENRRQRERRKLKQQSSS